MFATAKTLAAPKGKAKGKAKAEIEIAGLENLAAIDAVIKALTALKATVESDVKGTMAEHFIEAGAAKNGRPENFRGTDGKASASCELRARSSSSPLAPADVELLDRHGISHQTVETTIETYVINPAYKDDQALLGKVEKALKKVGGMPEDFILLQQGVAKTITTETSLDEVFRLNKNVASGLLGVVGVLAVKPKLESGDINDAFTIVQSLLNVEETEVADAA
jgi:hypothetical protein